MCMIYSIYAYIYNIRNAKTSAYLRFVESPFTVKYCCKWVVKTLDEVLTEHPDAFPVSSADEIHDYQKEVVDLLIEKRQNVAAVLPTGSLITVLRFLVRGCTNHHWSLVPAKTPSKRNMF